MPGARQLASLQLHSARYVLRRPVPARRRLGRSDDRLVFIVGCPRSGTTFLGHAIASLPGFIELGELRPFKASIPELAGLEPDRAATRVRRIIGVARVLGLVGSLRGVEHTPETSFVVDRVAEAFPEARFVHIVRDGRDVACSLLTEGFFRSGRSDSDEVEFTLGSQARFWVEPERAQEFPAVSEAGRAAWAWRRYVSAVRSSSCRPFELRYEQLAGDPAGTASRLASFLDAPADALAEQLGQARSSSIGRHREDLDPAQLADVLSECGDLLGELGYR